MNIIVAKKNHPQYVGLSSTGQFIKFRHKTQLQIGEQADIKPAKFNISSRAIVGIAAAFIFTTVSVLGYAYTVPSDYLYIDINPSIELAVNCFDQVISAKGLNSDGEAVLSETLLNYNSTEKSVEKIIEKAVEKGYMAENIENVVLINTSGNAKTLEKIKEKINVYTNSGKLDKIHPQIEIDSVNKTQMLEAKSQNISAGKLKLIEKAQQNTKLSKEQLIDMPVREIMNEMKAERIKEKSQESKNTVKDQTQTTEKENKINPNKIPDEKKITNKVPRINKDEEQPSIQPKEPIQNKNEITTPKVIKKDNANVKSNDTAKVKPDKAPRSKGLE